MKPFAYLYFLFAIHCCSAQTAYLFTARRDNPGFFSAFASIIAALDFCDQHDAMLGIDFQKEGWYYDSQKGPNWWNYYFDQPRLPLKTPIQEIKKGSRCGKKH